VACAANRQLARVELPGGVQCSTHYDECGVSGAVADGTGFAALATFAAGAKDVGDGFGHTAVTLTGFAAFTALLALGWLGGRESRLWLVFPTNSRVVGSGTGAPNDNASANTHPELRPVGHSYSPSGPE